MKINLSEVEFRKLDISCIPTLLDIQEETFEYAKGDTDFLRRNTTETFSLCFSGNSVVLGAYLKGEMVAFGILHCAEDTKENLAHDIDEVENILENANVKLIIVRPTYRGNGLQVALINKLSEYAIKSGYKWLSATVAPSNVWSENNFKKCGFKQVKILQKYGGMQRILLAKKV